MRQLMKVCMMVGLFAFYCQGNFAYAASGDYQYSSYGNTGNVTTATSYGINLMGGGTDVDEAMLWMAKKANQGDFVVLRTSGSDGYNQYLYDLAQSNNAKLDSVETIVLNNKYASSDSYVLDKVRKAEAVFLPEEINSIMSISSKIRLLRMYLTSRFKIMFRLEEQVQGSRSWGNSSMMLKTDPSIQMKHWQIRITAI